MDSIGQILSSYNDIFNDIANKLSNVSYSYESNKSFCKNLYNKQNNKVSNRIIWNEILSRIHYASVTSILRECRWYNGIVFGINSNNLMVFSASLRSLVEAITDSDYSLKPVPTSLCLNFINVKNAINGKLLQEFLAPELEDLLSRYTYVDKGCNLLKPLSYTKYIELFDRTSNVNTKALYSDLCQIAHPTSKSIQCFTSKVENSDYITICGNMDDREIGAILSNHKNAILHMLEMSITPFICLKILNLYEYNMVYTKNLDYCLINNLIDKDKWHEYICMKEQGLDYFLNNLSCL